VADLAEQQTIPGQVPVLINHTYALTIENLSVQRTRSSSVATGFAGNFAKRTGVYQYSLSFEMPPLATGWEVPVEVLAAPFTLTYRVGALEYSLDGCEVNDDSLSVAMQQGNTQSTFRGNALQRKPQ
jgi:hypothetical protein